MAEQESAGKRESRVDKLTRTLTSLNGLIVAVIAIVGSATALIALANGPMSNPPTPSPAPLVQPAANIDPGRTDEPAVPPEPTDPPFPTDLPPTVDGVAIEDWAAAADEACEGAAPNLLAAFQAVPLDPATAWDTAAGIVVTLADYFASLDAPAEWFEDIDFLIIRLEDSARALSDGAFAVRSGDAQGYGAATLRYQQAIGDSRDAAAALGATSCATLFS